MEIATFGAIFEMGNITLESAHGVNSTSVTENTTFVSESDADNTELQDESCIDKYIRNKLNLQLNSDNTRMSTSTRYISQ
jgi:hypothetical protein